MPQVRFDTTAHRPVVQAQEEINAAAARGKDQYDKLAKASEEFASTHKAATDRAKRSQQEYTDTVGKTDQAHKTNQAAITNWDRVAQSIIKRNQTSQERYNQLVAQAAEAHKKGLISAQDYTREVAKIGEEQDSNTGRFKVFEEMQEQSFGAAAIARIGTYVTSLVSIAAAQRAITFELQEQQRIRDMADAAEITVSQSRTLLRRNLGDVPDAVRQRVEAENRALAQSLGQEEQYINQARAQALSAGGGDVPASRDAVIAAALFLADRPTEIGAFAGSLLDVAKVTGTTDAETNLGLMTTVGALSRVVDPGQQAQNIPRSLIGQVRLGGATGAEAASLFASLTAAGGDITGARTGTAAISLSQQLRDFDVGTGAATTATQTAERDYERARQEYEKQSNAAVRKVVALSTKQDREMLDFAKNIRKQHVGPFAEQRAQRSIDLFANQQRQELQHALADMGPQVAPAKQRMQATASKLQTMQRNMASAVQRQAGWQNLTMGQRIQFLQQNPELAETFLGGATFERVAQGPIEALLTDTQSEAAQMFRSGLERFGSNEQLAATGQNVLQSVAGAEISSVVRERVLQAIEQTELLRVGEQGKLSQKEIESLRTLLIGSGMTAIQERIAERSARIRSFGGILPEYAQDMLEDRIRALSRPRFGSPEERIPLEQRQQSIAQLEEALRAIERGGDQQVDLLQQIRDELSNMDGSLQGVGQ